MLLKFWTIWKILSFPKLKLTLITLKMDSLFSAAVAAVAAAAETIPPKNIPTSLVHIYTCHKKKLVQNNEKQGRDMINKGLWVKKPKIHPFLPIKSANSAESLYCSISTHWQVICKVNLTKQFFLHFYDLNFWSSAKKFVTIFFPYKLHGTVFLCFFNLLFKANFNLTLCKK